MSQDNPTCRYCAGPIWPGQGVLTLAYWHQTPDVAHRACKLPGEKQEALDCQTIDADCNDCAHFRRGAVVKAWLSDMQDGQGTLRLVSMDRVTGYCVHFHKLTLAHPHQWTGLPCFIHRRAATIAEQAEK